MSLSIRGLVVFGLVLLSAQQAHAQNNALKEGIPDAQASQDLRPR